MSTQVRLQKRPSLYEIVMCDPETNTHAFLIIDTLKSGFAGGGIRMTPHVTQEEVRRLAQAMTYKFSAVDVPMGGCKAGIVADPNAPDKTVHLEAFARMVKPFLKDMYIAGEDMGTTATDVGLIYRAANCSWVELVKEKMAKQGVNLEVPANFDPSDFQGVNLEEELTGYGVAEVTEEACEVIGLDASQAEVAIQGFGTVGSITARNLFDKGFTIIAVADVEGTIHCPDGLPIDALLSVKDALGMIDRSQLNFEHQLLHRDEWLGLDADILIPAALADTIHRDNVAQIGAKLVVEAANIPTTPEAQRFLFEQGIAVVPDFIANAGAAGGFGMILTGQVDFEPESILSELGKRLRRTTNEVLSVGRAKGILPREVAIQLAEQKL